MRPHTSSFFLWITISWADSIKQAKKGWRLRGKQDEVIITIAR